MKPKLPKSVFFLLALFFLNGFLTLKANENEKKIEINLETTTNQTSWNYIPSVFKGDYTSFRGIPRQLNKENSIIKYFIRGIDSIFVLVGDIDSTKRICVIDANKNLDFSDDYTYRFDKEKITWRTNFPAQLISYRIKNGNDTLLKQYFYRPDLFDFKNLTITPGNDLFHKYFVMLRSSECYEGMFSVNKKAFKIIIFGDSKEYLIVDSVSPCETDDLRMKKRFLPITQKTLLDNYLFENLQLSNDNSILTVDVKNFDSLNIKDKEGNNEGFYALPFNKNDINNRNFNLDNYKGSYVLIDFWGTWCNPCIALLPHISEIHKKYPKLKIISVAVEMDEKGKSKIPDFVKKYEMEWVNLCEFTKEETTIRRLYNISSYPTTILIAPDGKIVHRGSAFEVPLLDNKLEEIFKNRK